MKIRGNAVIIPVGQAFVSRELEEELASLSVPIKDRNGKTIAAMNMGPAPWTRPSAPLKTPCINGWSNPF